MIQKLLGGYSSILAWPFLALVSAFTFSGSAAPGDGHWDRQFAMPGPSTRSIAIRFNGNTLYTGGYSLDSGQLSSNTVVNVHDGTNWSAIDGISGSAGTTIIYDFGFLGTDLYVGGIFNRAGGNAAMGLARWNGSSWSGVGGFAGFVVAMASDGTNLYVGGSFTNCGGVFATNLAKWDGTNWSALGSGLGYYESVFSQVVNTLVWRNGQLYAGGAFTNSGGTALTNLAVWNGSTWAPVGNGVAGNGSPFTGSPVATLQFIGNDLYVAGNFTTVGGNVSAQNIARWNGSSWSALGSGLKAAPNNSPVAYLAALGSDLYAIGNFTNAGGLSASGIARWNGSSWSPSGGRLNGTKSHMISNAGSLYISGDFNTANFDTPTNVIGNRAIRFDGTNWYGIYGRNGQGANLFGQVLALGNDGLYLGGFFSAVNTNVTPRIARWDGTRWYPLGSGVSGSYQGNSLAVRGIDARSSEVFVGGAFVSAGSVIANNIAKWDGADWSALGYGVDYTVSAVKVVGTDVCVGGSFTNAFDAPFAWITANRIAKWNESTGWQTLGAGVGGTVTVITESGGLIYAGGSFTTAGGNTANRIAVWDGNSWSPLGTGTANGLGGTVNAILVDGSEVYVGGAFTTAGGVTARAIAKWNGSSWSPVGQGMFHTSTANVTSLVKIGSHLYACGTFTNAGGSVVTRNVGRWDGTKWEALGSGVGNDSTPGASRISTAVAWNNDLYVAGIFETAGVCDSANVGRWNDQIDFTPPSLMRLSNPRMLGGNAFTFHATATENATYVIEHTADLVNWTTLSTNSTSQSEVTNTAPNVDRRHYRMRQVP
jgi:trimeric autotransporter adhesin